jgi:hypothetical protein
MIRPKEKVNSDLALLYQSGSNFKQRLSANSTEGCPASQENWLYPAVEPMADQSEPCLPPVEFPSFPIIADKTLTIETFMNKRQLQPPAKSVRN